MEDFNDDGLEIITVTDEDTQETIDFAVIDYTLLGGNEYVLVVDADCLEDDEQEAAILKKVTVDGEDRYILIEDDDEFRAAADIFSAEGEEYDIQL